MACESDKITNFYKIWTMTQTNLKKRIIEGIEQTRNTVLLEEDLRLLNLKDQDLEVYELNDAKINAIDEGREQIKNGQTLTNEEVNDEIDKWLGK